MLTTDIIHDEAAIVKRFFFGGTSSTLKSDKNHGVEYSVGEAVSTRILNFVKCLLIFELVGANMTALVCAS